MATKKVYRVGTQDKRERYSNRVQLLIFENDRQLNPEYALLRDTLFVILEFDTAGAPVGRDVLDEYVEAKREFDALVEIIQNEEGAEAVFPI